jgi:hypothetical protein
MDCLALTASDRLRGDKMTKPESQKTGMDTTAPVRLIASEERASPISLMTVLAITRAPPPFSRITPMIVPAAMTIPM